MQSPFDLRGDSSSAEAQVRASASKRDEAYKPRCLSLDLEVGKEDGRIRAFGAVRGDTGQGHSGGGSAASLAKLDELADGASFVLGHNLIAFDLPHLKAAKPDLRLLFLPAVDTLRLSPLAFPRNPYHHLVKHYQGGGLKRGQINDPELDSRLALELFADQRNALRGAEPDLLAAWHWLTTPEFGGADRALDDLFAEMRGARRPTDAEARAAMGHLLDGSACAIRGREARGGRSECPLAIRLRAGVAVGGRRQLGGAALGAPPVPGYGAPRALAEGHGLQRGCLRLVP